MVLEGEDACLAAAGDGVSGGMTGSGIGGGGGGWPVAAPGEARGTTPNSRHHRSHLATLDFNLQQVTSFPSLPRHPLPSRQTAGMRASYLSSFPPPS